MYVCVFVCLPVCVFVSVLLVTLLFERGRVVLRWYQRHDGTYTDAPSTDLHVPCPFELSHRCSETAHTLCVVLETAACVAHALLRKRILIWRSPQSTLRAVVTELVTTTLR